MFSRPGKMASYPCFHERHYADVASPCSMQDLQEKAGLAARDHQALQAHEVLLVTRGPRARRVLLGLQGTVTPPPALATAWEVSSDESGLLPLAEVWVALSNSPSEMEATNETCTKMWWLPKNLRVQWLYFVGLQHEKKVTQRSDQRK